MLGAITKQECIMAFLDLFPTLFSQSANLIWHPWQGGIVAGCFMTAITGVAIELRERLFRTTARIDLSRRGVGAFGWQNRAVSGVLEPIPESESRNGQGWILEARSRQRPEQNSDFFDTVELDSDHLAFYLGEVSGGGLPASLCQASCKALLRYACFTPGKAESVMEEVNSVLCQREPDGRFTTLLYGVLRLSTGELSMVSAGQTDPIVQRADGTVQRLMMPLRLPLGMTDRPGYETVNFRLKAGDRILLVSDGVTQARDRSRQPLSHDRLQVMSHKQSEAPLGEWADSILESVNRYDERLTDDRTVVALGYLGSKWHTSI